MLVSLWVGVGEVQFIISSYHCKQKNIFPSFQHLNLHLTDTKFWDLFLLFFVEGYSGKESQMLLRVESFAIFTPPHHQPWQEKNNFLAICFIVSMMQAKNTVVLLWNAYKWQKSVFMIVFVWLKQHERQVVGYTLVAEALLSFPTFLRIQEYPSRGFTAIKLVCHDTNVT